MTYSYTQISQYLACPRRYRHRYLDGWQEKDTRAAMLFGRAFEQAVAGLLPATGCRRLCCSRNGLRHRTWVSYSERDTWDRMLQQGIQLLERFAQDGRVRIRRPRRNLQIKFTKALGRPATTSSPTSMPLENWTVPAACWSGRPLPADIRKNRRIAGSRSATGLLFLDDRDRRSRPGSVRPQAAGRSPVFPRHDHRRTAPGVCHLVDDTVRRIESGLVPAAQRHPLSPEPLYHLSLHRPLPRQARPGRSGLVRAQE